MRSKFTKKRMLTLVSVLVVALAGIAYAFWTAAGSGTGSGSAATDASSVSVIQTSTISGLTPGGPAQDLSGNFNNPNSGPVQLSSVGVDSPAVTTDKVGCDNSDFTITGTGTVANSGQVPAGSGQGSWSGLHIQMVNKTADNQNACKGAAVTVHYTAN